MWPTIMTIYEPWNAFAPLDHDLRKSLFRASDSSKTDLYNRRPTAILTRDFALYSNPSSFMRAIYPPGHRSNGPTTALLPRDCSRDNQPPSLRSVLPKKSTASCNSKCPNLKNLLIPGSIQRTLETTMKKPAPVTAYAAQFARRTERLRRNI